MHFHAWTSLYLDPLDVAFFLNLNLTMLILEFLLLVHQAIQMTMLLNHAKSFHNGGNDLPQRAKRVENIVSSS